jgi:hypothetical protein
MFLKVIGHASVYGITVWKTEIEKNYSVCRKSWKSKKEKELQEYI